jgi:hypothetical protein
MVYIKYTKDFVVAQHRDDYAGSYSRGWQYGQDGQNAVPTPHGKTYSTGLLPLRGETVDRFRMRRWRSRVKEDDDRFQVLDA